MKYLLRVNRSAVITGVIFLLTSTLSASSISFVDQFKNLGFNQTGNGNTLTATGGFYSADLNSTTGNAYTSASFTPQGGSPLALTLSPGNTTDYHYQTSTFATKALMDAAFPFGTYSFSGVAGSTDMTSYAYSADSYATSNPYLTGTDYSSLQGMNASQAFTFHFSPFNGAVTGGNNSAILFFTIYDYTLGMNVFDAGFLSPTTSSVTVAGGTLKAGDMFGYEIDFSNRVSATTANTTFPGSINFDVRTDGTFTSAAAAVPEPSTALPIGLGLIVAALSWGYRKSQLQNS